MPDRHPKRLLNQQSVQGRLHLLVVVYLAGVFGKLIIERSHCAVRERQHLVHGAADAERRRGHFGTSNFRSTTPSFLRRYWGLIFFRSWVDLPAFHDQLAAFLTFGDGKDVLEIGEAGAEEVLLVRG